VLYIYPHNSRSRLPCAGKTRILPPYRGLKIIAFSPHADDLSISAGGFLSHLTTHNQVVPALAYTGWRGVMGHPSRRAAIARREKEMRREARILSLADPVFLRLSTYEDTSPKARTHDVAKIKSFLLRMKPDLILAPAITDQHPRHRLLTSLIRRALKTSRLRVQLLTYETPWSLFKNEDINFLVPLSRPAFIKKIKAIGVHASQLSRTDFVKISRALSTFRAAASPEQLLGYGSSGYLGQWLEAYRLIT
jgi:LmbE family N-acetylglucosaminyl deacetylase